MGIFWLLAGCVVEVGPGATSWVFDSPRTVRAEVGSGDIDVVSSSDARLWVDWDGGGIGDNAVPDIIEYASGRVVIDANGGIVGGGGLTMDAPAGTELDLVVDRGSIDVWLDHPTDVRACVGAGSIDLAVAPGPYRIDVGVGVGAISTEVWHDPTAPYSIEVCVGAGDVQIRSSR